MVSSGKMQTPEPRLLTLSEIVQGLDKCLCCLLEPAAVRTSKVILLFLVGTNLNKEFKVAVLLDDLAYLKEFWGKEEEKGLGIL